MAPPTDANGTMKYWLDGQPFDGVGVASRDPGSMKFFLDGQPAEPILFLGGTFIQTILSDARIQATQVQTILSLADIMGTTVQTILSDTLVVNTFSNNIPSDADIFATVMRTILSDAAVAGTTTQTILSDAQVVNTSTVTILSDAHILAVLDADILSDAVIAGTTIQTILSDAAVNLVVQESILSDAVVAGTTIRTLDSDSAVVVTSTAQIYSNAIVLVPLDLSCAVRFTAPATKDVLTEVEVTQTPPTIPTGLVVLNTGTGDSLRLEWTGTSSFYNVYRVDTGPVYVKLNNYLISDNFFVVGGLDEGVTYTFIVRGADGEE